MSGWFKFQRRDERFITTSPLLLRRYGPFRRATFECLEERRLLAATAYTWQDAAIGAGGFLDGVFFDPQHSGVMYARTDIGGLYKSTNGGNNWQPLLDFVGNSTSTSGNSTQSGDMQVLSFAIDPENSNNLYALVGSAVLYSTDAGQTWGIDNLSFSVNGNGPGRAAGERIAVDPYDSNIVLVGSNTANGLYESTNAGHSFTQVASFSTADPITFILFNPYSGTAGSPTQNILVGQMNNSSGSNIFETTNGGSSWTQVANSSGPASLYPRRAAFDSANDGDVYFTYSNQIPPEGTIGNNGGVWRYNVNTSTWANITPVISNGLSTSEFVGLGVDAENPGTVVVTTFDHYSTGDLIFRTANANAASPTWVSLYGGTSTRNTTQAPYMAAFGDGIGNWAATAAIDPFNPAHIVYGTGQGLWTTLTGNSSATLTAANSWYFLDSGIDFTAVLKLVAPQTGVPLFSAIGDINGFAHTTLTSSPSGGGIGESITNGGIGTMNSVDFAQDNPNFEAIVGGTGSHDGAFTTNDGLTWTEFAARPGNNASGGSVAVSADGSTIVWAASGKTPFFSTNDGTAWTASTMPSGTLTGGTVISDRVNANTFYYWTENSSDNQWKLYISTDGGHTFTQQTGATLGDGNITLVANPTTAGDLWLSSYNGVYHSTNSGASFAQIASIGFANVPSIALGAPPPGKTFPAIYIYGTIASFQGVYRSDDGGTTWTLLNDVSHQWGGLVDTMAADPNVFGRVYLGINGRGVIVGNPASSLPAGWADADVNSPGNPGWAMSSTSLSNGTTVNQWIINGGGAGIGGVSDQFNFAYQTLSGSATVSAELLSLINADGGSGTPAAGVMFRAGTNSSEPFAAMLQTAGNNLIFEYRTTSGGSVTSISLSSVPVGTEYVRIARDGDNFSGFYSSDGVNWTQLGVTIAIAAMPDMTNAGLVATAAFNAQLASATFSNVSVLLKGDINLDGHRDMADVTAMMKALVDLPTYQSSHNLSGTDLLTVADVDGDGQITNLDLEALLNLLLAGDGSFSSDGAAINSTSTTQAGTIVPNVVAGLILPAVVDAGPPLGMSGNDVPVSPPAVASLVASSSGVAESELNNVPTSPIAGVEPVVTAETSLVDNIMLQLNDTSPDGSVFRNSAHEQGNTSGLAGTQGLGLYLEPGSDEADHFYHNLADGSELSTELLKRHRAHNAVDQVGSDDSITPPLLDLMKPIEPANS